MSLTGLFVWWTPASSSLSLCVSCIYSSWIPFHFDFCLFTPKWTLHQLYFFLQIEKKLSIILLDGEILRTLLLVFFKIKHDMAHHRCCNNVNYSQTYDEQHYSAHFIINFDQIRTFTLNYLALLHVCISWAYKEPSAHAPIPISEKVGKGGGGHSPLGSLKTCYTYTCMYIVFAGPKYGRALVNNFKT